MLTLIQHFEMYLTLILFLFVEHLGLSQKTLIFHGTI